MRGFTTGSAPLHWRLLDSCKNAPLEWRDPSNEFQRVGAPGNQPQGPPEASLTLALIRLASLGLLPISEVNSGTVVR